MTDARDDTLDRIMGAMRQYIDAQDQKLVDAMVQLQDQASAMIGELAARLEMLEMREGPEYREQIVREAQRLGVKPSEMVVRDAED